MAKPTYRQIEAFRAVMQSGTTTGAANIMCISQPAVSRLLSDLESELSVTLFERNKKRLLATPEAHVLYTEVERSFISIEQIARVASDLKECHLGLLRVACMPAVSIDFMPKITHVFSQQNEGVSLSLQVRSTQQSADLVASQQYDLALVSAIPLTDASIEVETLAGTHMICALPPGHRLVDKASISPEDLENEFFISLGNEQRIRNRIDEVFEKANVNLRKVIDTQLVNSACAFVLQGAGVSIVEPIGALHYKKLGLVLKRFEPQIKYRYNLIYPAHKKRSTLTKKFVALIQSELKQLAEENSDWFEIFD